MEISDFGVDKAEAYFNSIWERSYEITEDNKTKEQLLKIIKQETLVREISPYEAYVFVLKNYLDAYNKVETSKELRQIMEKRRYKIYSYQIDAIKQALAIIRQNNGVIIADVVGLGKTIIACAIAFELKERGIVIAPPALLGNDFATKGWNKYLEDFGLATLGWKAFSLGELEDVLEFTKKNEVKVVIVDEAHRFRNQNTKSYDLLKSICIEKTVILLTATPFNNKPSDIFSLLKLFIVPKKSSITLTDNLKIKFDKYEKIFNDLSYILKHAHSIEPKQREKAESLYRSIFRKSSGQNIDVRLAKDKVKKLAREIKSVIEPVVIRRNRLDLQKHLIYRNEIDKLSLVRDPIEWFFSLTEEQSKFYDNVLKKYFSTSIQDQSFKGAIYKPSLYEKDIEIDMDDLDKEESFEFQQQYNLYNFMRRLLVKRFESSFGALKQSLENFKVATKNALTFIKKTNKFVLDKSFLEKIYDKDLEEIEIELTNFFKELDKNQINQKSKHKKLYEIDRFKKRRNS